MTLETPIRVAHSRTGPAYGFWLTYPNTAIAKTFLRATAKNPVGGFSWAVVDGEHGLISDVHYYDLCNAVAAEGVSPVIRIPYGQDWIIKRALDSGAHGIMSPMCHTADEARRIVSYSKYPPLGTRGYGPLHASHAFPAIQPTEYDHSANQQLLVVVQIESRPGVDNVEEIARVDGLDVLLIGPFDLALQLGVAKGGEEHERAIQRVLQACKAANKKAAIFCSDGNDTRNRAEQGFDMVSISTDVGLIQSAVMNEWNIATGTRATTDAKSGY